MRDIALGQQTTEAGARASAGLANGVPRGIDGSMNPRLNSLPAVLALAAALGLAPESRAAGPKTTVDLAQRGARLYADCAKCHGEQAEGIESNQAPRLAGREEWYLRRQLKKFRDLQRGYTEPKDNHLPAEDRTRFMHPVASGVSKADTDALVTHIRTRQPSPVAQHPVGDAEKGRKLFANCLPCHGVSAEGSKRKDAPALRDQHGWYLFSQIRDFRMGWRGTDPRDVHGRLMRENTDIDDDGIHSLAAYITGLSQPRK